MTRQVRLAQGFLALFLLAAAGAAAAQAAAPFLWRVDGPLATSYLLGSVHLLPETADTLPDALEDAYDETDGAVFETDIGALSSRSLQLRMVAAAHSRRGLRAELGVARYARVRRRAQALAMPMILCDGYKPWFCALSLGIYAFQRAGFSDEYGIDAHFYGEAVSDGKPVRWLESPSRHLALFTGMSTSESRALLDAALQPDSGAIDSPQALYRAWRNGDGEAVATLDRRFKVRYPTLYRRLISARNHAWLPQLRELLDGGSAQLVVVGAAHLVGPDGLVPALRALGYRVSPGLAPQGDQLRAAWRPPRPRHP